MELLLKVASRFLREHFHNNRTAFDSVSFSFSLCGPSGIRFFFVIARTVVSCAAVSFSSDANSTILYFSHLFELETGWLVLLVITLAGDGQ